MKSLTKMLALAALAATIAAGTGTSSAQAKGWHGGGHHFGGHRGLNFRYGHSNCWRFGRYVCGSGY